MGTKGNSEYGGTILEYMLCMLIMLPLTLAIIGIFQLASTKMITDYAAYVGARAYSLGYNEDIVRRATQMAAAGAAGPDISDIPMPTLPTSADATSYAKDYRRNNNQEYYVNFLYWREQNDTNNVPSPTALEMSFNPLGDQVTARVWFKDYPLLLENLKNFFSYGNQTEIDGSGRPVLIPSGYHDTPVSTAQLKNHSTVFLDN